MKPIDKTEAYNEAMRSIRISHGGKEMIMLQADMQFHQYITIESEMLSDYDKTKVITERLAYDLVLSVLKQCGITHKDISLLEIAKELAAEEDTGDGTCGLECGSLPVASDVLKEADDD